MEIKDVKILITQDIPDAEVFVQGEGTNFSADVISESFQDITKLNRQRAVLKLVKAHIQSGEIHALSINAYTPAEWDKRGELKII